MFTLAHKVLHMSGNFHSLTCSRAFSASRRKHILLAGAIVTHKLKLIFHHNNARAHANARALCSIRCVIMWFRLTMRVFAVLGMYAPARSLCRNQRSASSQSVNSSISGRRQCQAVQMQLWWNAAACSLLARVERASTCTIDFWSTTGGVCRLCPMICCSMAGVLSN